MSHSQPWLGCLTSGPHIEYCFLLAAQIGWPSAFSFHSVIRSLGIKQMVGPSSSFPVLWGLVWLEAPSHQGFLETARQRERKREVGGSSESTLLLQALSAPCVGAEVSLGSPKVWASSRSYRECRDPGYSEDKALLNAQGKAETLPALGDAYETGQNGWSKKQPQLGNAPMHYHLGLVLCSHLPTMRPRVRDQDEGRIGGFLPGRAEVMDKPTLNFLKWP